MEGKEGEEEEGGYAAARQSIQGLVLRGDKREGGGGDKKLCSHYLHYCQELQRSHACRPQFHVDSACFLSVTLTSTLTPTLTLMLVLTSTWTPALMLMLV